MLQLLSRTTDPRPLAVARILVGLASLPLAVEWLAPLRRVSSGEYLAVPTLGGLSPSPPIVLGLFGLAVAAGVAMVLGLTRWPAFIVAGTAVAAMLMDQQTYSNHLVLLASIAFLLGLSGAHRVLRLGRRDTVTEVSAWPACLVMAQISTLYLWTGISKINEQYLSGEVIEANLRSWAVPPGGLLTVVAIASLSAEIFLAAALWIRPLFLVALLVGFGLHGGILAVLLYPEPLVPFAVLMLSGYVLFGWRWAQQRRPGVAEANQAVGAHS